MAMKSDIDADLSTEQKIKEAARKVFTQKGFSATRTRDIAEEAGINLALLNYYFRSKEKLFEQVMMERMQQLFGTLAPIITNATTGLEVKIELIVSHYIDMLQENPDLPIFVLSEIRKNPDLFSARVPIIQFIEHSPFIVQLREKRPDINPFHFLLNILGMTIFPFIASPVIASIPLIQQQGAKHMMEERRALIPVWIKAMLEIPEVR